MTEKYISMTHKEREYQFVDGESMVIKDGCFTAFLNYSPWLYGHVKNTCIRPMNLPVDEKPFRLWQFAGYFVSLPK